MTLTLPSRSLNGEEGSTISGVRNWSILAEAELVSYHYIIYLSQEHTVAPILVLSRKRSYPNSMNSLLSSAP